MLLAGVPRTLALAGPSPPQVLVSTQVPGLPQPLQGGLRVAAAQGSEAKRKSRPKQGGQSLRDQTQACLVQKQV